MAEMIGSDVPFFIFQSAAVCKGRGELVNPTRLREQLSVLLLKPEFGVPTQWAYSRWRDSREIPGVSYAAQEFAEQTFRERSGAPCFRKICFFGPTENVVTQATRSRRRANVRLRFHNLRRDCSTLQMSIIWLREQSANSIRNCGRVCATRDSEFWGAHACGVLVCGVAPIRSSFRILRAATRELVQKKIVSAGRRNQHARRVRSPDCVNTREAIRRVVCRIARARIRG